MRRWPEDTGNIKDRYSLAACTLHREQKQKKDGGIGRRRDEDKEGGEDKEGEIKMKKEI